MFRLITLLLLFSSLSVGAQQVEVQAPRISNLAEGTRLAVDLSAAVSHRIFPLDNPHRLVIDIPDARLTGDPPPIAVDEPLLLGIRSGIRDGDDLRLVLDLKQEVRAKSFLRKPDRESGHRLVVDLSPAGKGEEPARSHERQARQGGDGPRDVVVAIDAGHGGADVGAVGAKGTREKDVTLAIARKLARLVEKEPGMRPVLIRDGDYFIRLRQRIDLARRNDADLFVSIHADAFRDPHVGGSSVYTLSQSGASSEMAKWLADKENSADLVGGIDLAENDSLLASVLLDMTQSATLEHSDLAAKQVLAHLGKLGEVHKASVQRAGFVVLKSPDIPSMLVETAFISNPKEEERLRSGEHQARVARAILAGIRSYFLSHAPPGTKLVAGNPGKGRKYVIDQGDTLSEIAARHGVSLGSLRAANGIEGDRIRVGQVLTIPEG